jgi:uncharacterized repeat protein (TIGR01451 family)/LPXTG-motif cell wall-anchored protein
LIDLIKTGTFQDESGDGFAQPGETVNYTFTVENTGNVTLTDVTLADTVGGVTISGGPIATMAPGAVDTTTFTGSYVVTQGDIDAGTFDNIATVTGTPPGENPPVTDDGDAQTPLTQNPVIVLGSIGDLVWNDLNENGIQDGDEKGVAGVTLRLTLPGGTTRETITNANGAYLFDELPEGEYTVKLVLSSVVLASGEDAHLVTAGFFGIGADDATIDTSMLLAAASVTGSSGLTVTTPSSYTIQLDAGQNYLDADFGVVAVLPITGLDTTTIALIALVLLLAGGAAVFVATRKREDEVDITTG